MVFAGSYDGTLRALPLDASERAAPELRQNILFWLSFPLMLGPIAFLAILLTRIARARRRKDALAHVRTTRARW